MKIYDVWYNQGRWIVRCPVCGGKTHIKPKPSNKTVKWYCGNCFPDKFARKPAIIGNKVTLEQDHEKKRVAAEQANAMGEIYTAVMPEDWQKAEALLRVRRLPHQGWYPGDFEPPNNKQEPLSNLQDENDTDPKLEYLRKQVSPKPLPESAEDVPAVKELSDRIYRSLQ